MSVLNFKMFKNSDKIKDLIIDTDLSDWKIYRNTLNTFKKNINEYLTRQVELEKVTGDNETGIEDDSESSEDEKGFKRVLVSTNSLEKSNKIPKT